MSCRQTIHGTNSSHGHSVLNCNKGGRLEYYALGCGKNGNTAEGYRPGCGLKDGQIIAAHIVYNGEGLKPSGIDANAFQETDISAGLPEQQPEVEETEKIPEEIQSEPEMENPEEKTDIGKVEGEISEPETETEKPEEEICEEAEEGDCDGIEVKTENVGINGQVTVTEWEPEEKEDVEGMEEHL